MGILRVFFALIVLLGHSPASYYLQPIFSGPLAVEAFYIISGFYIQLIITSYSRQTNWIANFYASRLTRIFSTYYLILLTTLAFRISTGHDPLHVLFHKGSDTSVSFGIFINLFIVGQDIARLFAFDLTNGGMNLVPSGNWAGKEIPFAAFEVLVQAWTLAPELLFYFLAPFLLSRGTLGIAVIATLSLYLKFWLEGKGANWTTLFFPCELGFFLLGTLAYRIYERYIKHRDDRLLPLAVAAVLSVAVLYLSIVWYKLPAHFHYGLDDRIQRLAYMLIVAASLPFIFKVSRHSKIDRAIGELSYPIYLVHILILEMLDYIYVESGYVSVTALGISILAAIPIARYIEVPTAHLRHRLFRKHE